VKQVRVDSLVELSDICVELVDNLAELSDIRVEIVDNPIGLSYSCGAS
jgi:hypothetical protein